MSENESKRERNQPPISGGGQASFGTTLRAKEAARLIGVDAKTLANWRWKGCGPAYFKLPGRANKGAVRYDRDTVLAWLAQRTFTKEAIGGFDISLNEHRDGAFKSHWRPHAWIFIKADHEKHLRSELRSLFPKKGSVRLPIVLKRFDGNLRAIAYAFKTEFLRRVTIPADAKKGSRRNTRYRPLLARQKVDLALALDRIGLSARLFAIGIEIDSDIDFFPIDRSRTWSRIKSADVE